MTNMTTDDLMEILAGWGNFSINRTRLARSASPCLKGQPILWRAELRIPGYKGPYGPPRFETEGRTPSAVASALHEKVEAYFASPEAKEHRAAYVAENGDPNRPGRCLPDVRDPDLPDIHNEVYE